MLHEKIITVLTLAHGIICDDFHVFQEFEETIPGIGVLQDEALRLREFLEYI